MSKKKKKKNTKIKPRVPRGFRDLFAGEIIPRDKMLQRIRRVYELHGFEPLETSALEYVDVLGKFLPESDEPDGGIFALQDDDEQWISMRYDLTAPLSRVVSQYRLDLPNPFRRYQIGPVWRQEKPGPGRFRQFYQCDFDTVGSKSPAADAEVCSVMCKTLETLGLEKGDYIIRVNNRKILTGVLDAIGLEEDSTAEGAKHRLTILRAVDKLDRLGEDGVEELLGKGRLDKSGDYTDGAGLPAEAADIVMQFIRAGNHDRKQVCKRLRALVGESQTGLEGVEELEVIDELLTSMGYESDRVIFDPSVVRGLAYYTGPVFEAELTFEVLDKKGNKRSFGSVAGGGRYDGLVKRFTGQEVPATGASIGIDRLIAALQAKEMMDTKPPLGPIVVTVMDKKRLGDYQKMVAKFRDAGMPAELFLGNGGFPKQMKYADARHSPVAIIAGSDEFDNDQVSIKDLRLGAELSEEITDREEWIKNQPAQVTVPMDEMVSETQKILDRYTK